jgi:hypothetical protein
LLNGQRETRRKGTQEIPTIERRHGQRLRQLVSGPPCFVRSITETAFAGANRGFMRRRMW